MGGDIVRYRRPSQSDLTLSNVIFVSRNLSCLIDYWSSLLPPVLETPDRVVGQTMGRSQIKEPHGPASLPISAWKSNHLRHDHLPPNHYLLYATLVNVSTANQGPGAASETVGKANRDFCHLSPDTVLCHIQWEPIYLHAFSSTTGPHNSTFSVRQSAL